MSDGNDLVGVGIGLAAVGLGYYAFKKLTASERRKARHSTNHHDDFKHHKLRISGHYIRERMQPPEKLKRAGFTSFHTVQTAKGHKIIIASKPNNRSAGTRLQAVLHPIGERRTKFHNVKIKDDRKDEHDVEHDL